MPDAFKPVSMRQLQTALLDSRSPVDSVLLGSFSAKNNWEISVDGKLRQAHGFVKPYSTPNCEYKNWDWHDQGVPLADREPPTLYFASTSNSGVRRLFKGTKTRFLQLDESAGTWATIGSNYGNDGDANLTQTRWKAAQLQDTIVLTNGVDKVQSHLLGSGVMSEITTLNTAGESGGLVTKSNIVIEWQGLIFLMNMEEEGVRLASRIRWSDLNQPTVFTVGGASVSDFQDLTYGQRILAAIPLAGSLYIFTNCSVWKCNLAIDLITPAVTLACAEIYTEPKNEAKCLAYPNTLVSTGFSLYYASRDAIYEFNPYLPEPAAPDFIFKASDVIFDSSSASVIDRSACNSPIMEYWPETSELHFSWGTVEAIEVNATIDCDTYVPGAPVQGTGINRFTLVINTNPKHKTTDYRDYGSTALVNFRSDILVVGSCNQAVLFLGANGTDFSLKQFGVGYAREIYDPVSETYSMVGYVPMLKWIFPFDNFDKVKKIKDFLIDAAPESNTTALFKLRLGASDEALDPNKNINNCGVVWRNLSSKQIKCWNTKTPAQYASQNIRPVNPYIWGFLEAGRFLYCELKITNADGSPATTGGVSISRFEVSVVAV